MIYITLTSLIILCCSAFYTNAQGLNIDSLRTEAQRNNVEAQVRLGELLLKGKAKNKKEAVKWITQAAKAGNATAQYYLGQIFQYGTNGVRKNKTESFKWYSKAAEQGYVNAQFELGLRYKRGDGVAKDLYKAWEWYTKAAEGGHDIALMMLANYTYWGEEPYVKADKNEAMKWYNIMAEKGDTGAQYTLSVHYSDSTSSLYNPVLAFAWIIVANGMISPDLNEELVYIQLQTERLQSQLNSTQKAQAEIKAQELLARIKENKKN